MTRTSFWPDDPLTSTSVELAGQPLLSEILQLHAMDSETATTSSVKEGQLYECGCYIFPPPHQLGLSLYNCPRHPLAHVRSHPPSTSDTTLHRHSSSLGLDALPSKRKRSQTDSALEEPDIGPPAQDEPDVGPPPAKKAAVAPVQQPLVSTHDDTPLSELSLFLPPKVPSAIVQSRYALSKFVYSTSTTYLSLWGLADQLKVLNLRFPSPFCEKLCEDYQLLTDLLSSVCEILKKVKSLRDLYLPQMILHSAPQLDQILQPLVRNTCTVSHLFLPLQCSLQESEIANVNYKVLAAFFRKIKIREITLISTDRAVQEFQNKLQAELKKSPRAETIKVNYKNQELGVPGPEYIADLDKKASVGEQVDPLSLVNSLNVTGDGGGGVKSKRMRRLRERAHKEKAQGAFSTDCTYSDEAELSLDGPFVSEVWNLERLHNDGVDGSGTTIAVLDSGINFTHPAFKDKILAIKNFVPEDIDNIDCAVDSDGHGTLCAGIAAGNSFYCPINISDPSSTCIKIPPGVAPGANLVICKVTKTSNGDVDSEAFLAALKWLKELHDSGTKIDVVSISLASTFFSSERARVISDLTSLGIIVVCCASNVGRLRFQPISFPARLGQVLCIGAHDENGKPTSFSPVGRELDFLAPGENIWGPGPGTIGPFSMDCASGTSCATPAVAGLVCLILHAVDRISKSNPSKYQIAGKPLADLVHNVWVMRELLKEMSSSPGHHTEEIGYGTLNLYRILDRSPEEIMRVVNEIIEDE